MTLRDLVAYIIREYPHKRELTKGRLTKIVYLVDWAAAVENGRPVTDIRWEFNHYGPYVNDVYDMAVEDKLFSIKHDTNSFGRPIEVIGLSGQGGSQRLPAEVREIADRVIEQVKPMTWNRFISHVYDTYPVRTVERYNELPLTELVKTMKREGEKP